MSEISAEKSGESSSSEKLYAGKYKTAEEMETAIKAKDSEAVRMQSRLKELEAAKVTKAVPEVYDVPEHAHALGDELERYHAMGKVAKLSQEEFNHIVSGALEEKKARESRLDESKKVLGDKTVSILEEFVNNNKSIPTSMKKQALESLLTNENERVAALQERENKLNSKVPGMDSSYGGQFDESKKSDAEKDLTEAAKRWEKRPNDKNARNELIEAAAAAAEAKKK